MNKSRAWRLVFCLALLAALAIVTCCPLGQRVTLCTREGKTVYAARLPKGERVWVIYTHSVNKGVVEDGYEPANGKICLRCTRVRSYGAGIPEPEEGQTFTVCDGYYEIAGFSGPAYELDTMWTFVGRVADLRLRIGEEGELVHYNALAQPGTALGLSTDSWTLLKEFLWRCLKIG